MSEWKQVKVNKQNIIKFTEKAVLIKLPKSDSMFWHPRKLVREMKVGKGYWYSMSFTDEFIFRIKRYGKNNNILDEFEFSADKIEDIFGGLIFEDVDTSAKFNIPKKEYPQQHGILDELSE